MIRFLLRLVIEDIIIKYGFILIKKLMKNIFRYQEKNLNRRVKNNSNFKNNWYDQKISEKYKKELERLGFQIENESRMVKCCNCKVL